ncbi:MAG: hypothetical protein H7834_04220 [Magnetococcus sp. YQC-9]
MRRLIKIAGWTLVMALLSVVASLQTIVSSETFKRQLIATLTGHLPGTVTIETLSLDYLNGLQALAMTWRHDDKTLFKLDRLALAIDWSDLLLGRLTMRELRIHGGRLELSSGLLEESGNLSAAPQAPLTPHPALAPAWIVTTLPLQLALQAVVVEDVDLAYEPLPGARMGLRNLAMHAAARINRQGIDVRGLLTIEDLFYADARGAIHLPVSLKMDLGNAEGEEVRRTLLSVGELLRIPLDARLTLDRTPARIDLRLKAEPVELAPLLALIQPWLPEVWQKAQLAGTGSSEWAFQGSWQEGLTGRGDGTIELNGLQAWAPASDEKKALLRGGSARIAFSDWGVRGNAWQGMQSELHLKAEQMVLPEARAEKLSLLLGADHRPDGSLAGHGRVKVERLFPGGGSGEAHAQPFGLETKLLAAFDPERERFSIDRLVMKLGDFARMHGALHLMPEAANDTEQALSGALFAEVDGGKLALALARYLPEGVSLSLSPGTSRFTMRGRADLMSHWMPRSVALHGGIELAPFAWSQEGESEQAARGARLERLKLTWQAARPKADGPIEGAIAGRIGLAGLNTGGSLVTGPAELSLDARGQLQPESGAMSGQVQLDGDLRQPMMAVGIALERFKTHLEADLAGDFTPGAGFEGLRVTQNWSGGGTTLAITDGPGRWIWPEFTFTARAESDLTAGVHRLDSLTLDSGQALAVRLHGDYRSAADHLTLTGGVERIDLGRLSLVSGDPEGGELQEIKPFRGMGALQVEVDGVPGGLMHWSREAPPLIRIDLRASVAEFLAEWPGGRLSGGKGSARFEFTPEPGKGVAVSADLHAGRWEHATAHPKWLEQARFELDLVGRDPDHWRLQRLRGSIPGLEGELRGQVAGVTGLLDTENRRLTERLAGLFVDLQGGVRVDLERAKPVLASLDARGTGRGELDWRLTKAVNGPFINQMSLTPRDLGFAQGDFAIKGLTGTLLANKSTWTDRTLVPVKPRARRAFALERISTPLTSGIEGRRLNIASLEMAGVRAEAISMELSFQDNQIRGQNLRMELLGGTIGGNLLLEGSKPVRMDALFEGVEVDLNRLLPAESGIAGDGKVDFIARVALRFDKDSGRLDLGRSEVSILFTRIGKESLDRLLRFLDPRESNPALINARSKVSYANPSQMNLQLAKGTIKLQINFRSGLVSTLNLERIPLGVLGQFEEIQQDLQPVESFARLLEWLGMAYLESETRESTAQ